jgi:hypothetical protein
MFEMKQFSLDHRQVKQYINDVNSTLSNYVNGCKPVPLGPEYATFESYDVAQYELLHHRMKKKWGAPDHTAANAVAEKSVLDVFAYDRSGPDSIDALRFSTCDPFVRQILYKARLTLHEAIRKFYRFKPSNMRMPSGESDLSAQGDVSVLAKLRDKGQWRVTADCVDMFATVVYNIPALKAAARKHIGKMSHEEARQLYNSYSHFSDRGYRVFRELLISEVFTIVPGARVATVPKELDKLRVITCEPFGNMIVQSVIEEGLRDVVKQYFGIDLRTSQELHKELIKLLDNATIDLKNASNSNFLCWVRFLYPEHVMKQLEAARSPIGLYKDQEIVWNMISPMGNGFTFGLMTLTLLTIARELDSFAHVFGDDIIIHQDCAHELIQVLATIGFSTNETKTFITGRFRESCGAFTFDGMNLHSFEFHWAENICDAHTIVNKVQILADKTCIPALQQLALTLVQHVPLLCKKACVEFELTSRYVCITSRSARERKRESEEVKALLGELTSAKSRKHVLRSYVQVSQNLLRDADFYIESVLENDKYRCRLPTHNANAFWTGHFLFAGRCTTPTYAENRKHPLRVIQRIIVQSFAVKTQKPRTYVRGSNPTFLFPPIHLWTKHRRKVSSLI